MNYIIKLRLEGSRELISSVSLTPVRKINSPFPLLKIINGDRSYGETGLRIIRSSELFAML
jgi:hypothetical protein